MWSHAPDHHGDHRTSQRLYSLFGANALCYSGFQPMNIKKQRLLTPGPTPLYPKALQAMLGADIHHRTKDFRALYTSVLSDLKVVLGTAHDVLILAASGTGAMESSVTNCFSPGWSGTSRVKS